MEAAPDAGIMPRDISGLHVQTSPAHMVSFNIVCHGPMEPVRILHFLTGEQILKTLLDRKDQMRAPFHGLVTVREVANTSLL